MPDYELTFEIPPVSDQLEDSLVDHLDATIAEHSGVMTATLLASGTDAVAAARWAIRAMSGLGVIPSRLVDDLVSRSQIAERVGVSRQAVGHWIGGQRQVNCDFPPPFVLTAGGLWRWDEVIIAVRRMGIAVDDDALYPTRRDSQLIGGVLAEIFDSDAIALARATIESLHFGAIVDPGVQSLAAPHEVDLALAAQVVTREARDARDVVEHSELTDIRIYEVAARRMPAIAHGDPGGEQFSVTAQGSDEEFETRARMYLRTADAEFVVDAGAIYKFSEPLTMSGEVASEFMERVGIMAVYPFIREQVFSSARRIGTSAPVLGLLRAGQVKLRGQGATTEPPASEGERGEEL